VNGLPKIENDVPLRSPEAITRTGIYWFNLASIVIQVAAWGVFLWGLYYLIPWYKFVFRDSEFIPTGNFQSLGDLSTRLVVMTPSDETFPWLLSVVLLAIFGINFIVSNSIGGKTSVVWSLFWMTVPVSIVTIAFHAISTSVREFVDMNHDILLYQCWQIKLFVN